MHNPHASLAKNAPGDASGPQGTGEQSGAGSATPPESYIRELRPRPPADPPRVHGRQSAPSEWFGEPGASHAHAQAEETTPTTAWFPADATDADPSEPSWPQLWQPEAAPVPQRAASPAGAQRHSAAPTPATLAPSPARAGSPVHASADPLASAGESAREQPRSGNLVRWLGISALALGFAAAGGYWAWYQPGQRSQQQSAQAHASARRTIVTVPKGMQAKAAPPAASAASPLGAGMDPTAKAAATPGSTAPTGGEADTAPVDSAPPVAAPAARPPAQEPALRAAGVHTREGLAPAAQGSPLAAGQATKATADATRRRPSSVRKTGQARRGSVARAQSRGASRQARDPSPLDDDPLAGLELEEPRSRTKARKAGSRGGKRTRGSERDDDPLAGLDL